MGLFVGEVVALGARFVRVLGDGVTVGRDYRKRIAVRNVATNRLSYVPEWRLLKAKGHNARMTKKRGYSDEFPTTREKRVYFMLDKIPPALWILVKAKAKREGVSLRALILGWCKDWIDTP